MDTPTLVIQVSSTTGMNVNQVVTMGADGNVCVLNMRMNQHECVHKFEEHKDFICTTLS